MTHRMSFPPFGLSLSKPSTERSEVPHFVRLTPSTSLRANGCRGSVP